MLPLFFTLFATPAPTPIDREALARLMWAATVDCEALHDDALRRCRRSASGVALAGQTFTVPADAGALEVVDGALVVHGCLACAKPVDAGLAYHPVFVVTAGNVTVNVDGTEVVAPEIARLPHPPANVLAATISFSVPGRPMTWSQGGVAGIFVDLVGYAVFDRCDGQVVAATPPVPAAAPPRSDGVRRQPAAKRAVAPG